MSTAVPAAASEAPDAGANSAEQTTTEVAIIAAAAAVAATITDPPANAAELRRQRGAAGRALEKEVAAATRQERAHERLLDQEARRAAATALDGDRVAQQVTVDELHESRRRSEEAGRALQRDCARRLREAKAKAARKSAAAWATAAPVASESTEVRARIDSFLDKPLPAAAATAPSASAARPPRDLEASFLGRFGKLLDEYEECAEPLRGIVEEADASNDAFEEMLGGAEPAVPARAPEEGGAAARRRRRAAAGGAKRRPASGGGGADTSMMTHPASACRAPPRLDRGAHTFSRVPRMSPSGTCRMAAGALTHAAGGGAARGRPGSAPPGAENARANGGGGGGAAPSAPRCRRRRPRTRCGTSGGPWRVGARPRRVAYDGAARRPAPPRLGARVRPGGAAAGRLRLSSAAARSTTATAASATTRTTTSSAAPSTRSVAAATRRRRRRREARRRRHVCAQAASDGGGRRADRPQRAAREHVWELPRDSEGLRAAAGAPPRRAPRGCGCGRAQAGCGRAEAAGRVMLMGARDGGMRTTL